MLARMLWSGLASAVAVVAQDHGPPPFRWEPDLPTATAHARATGKPIAAYFTFDT